MRGRAPPSSGDGAAAVYRLEGSLLRSPSCFPYFMVVALEAGSLLRGLILLLLYPLLSPLPEEGKIRAMAFLAFCGLRVSSFKVGPTVLPKHLRGNLSRESLETLMAEQKKRKKKMVVFSKMPKVMVEEFLRKYLKVETFSAREMKVAFGFFTGFMAAEDYGKPMNSTEDNSMEKEELYPEPETSEDDNSVEGEEDLPEPLIFHDGRLAFALSPLSCAAMFVWVPLGCLLALLRAVLLVSLLLPGGLHLPILAFSGLHYRVVRKSPFYPSLKKAKPGSLFVCNHRTQIDHLNVSVILGQTLTSLIYGVASSSRLLSPLRTVALTRIREEDKGIMVKELERDAVVLCPEGTTCREPFVLRFSPLFTEIVDRVNPVAVSCHEEFFHGTTVNGVKAWDPLALLANPRVWFGVEFLGSVEMDRGRESRVRANRVQAEIAGALGFRCSELSRKDKYRYLAGTDGVYPVKP